MLNRIKIFVLKIIARLSLIYKFYGSENIKQADDFCFTLIKKYAPFNTFADIGCIWRVDGAFSFFAEESGARRVVGVDIYESKRFEEERTKRNSKVEFICGDINNREIVKKVGLCDIVFCSGVLYHIPNLLHFLSVLRTICVKTLILSSRTIPEINGLKNTLVFYPFLNQKQKRFWSLGSGHKTADKPYEPGNEYSTWFWGVSLSCIESMLKVVGFEIKERYLRPFQAFYVCSISKPHIPLRF